MKCMFTFALLAVLAASPLAQAQEYAVAKLDEAAPADDLSEEIAASLASTGWRITADGDTLIDLWLVKTWDARADFTPSIAVLYPLTHGQLLGVLRVEDELADFRDQEIDDGVYTLRYALQPEDGNHIGTSDTRDFLLVLPSSDDESAAVLSDEDLIALSADTAGGTHPAMLALLAAGEGPAQQPTIEHDEQRELWSLRLANPSQGGASDQLVLKLVFVGTAAE